MTERLVIDASVAAKWFLKDALEADVDLAEDILLALLAGDIELHAPRLISYEVCGLLAKACAHRGRGRASRLTKEKAVVCVREFFGLPIQIAEATAEEGMEALEMAVNYAKGHYDMTYIRLADKLDSKWCTADGKILQAVPGGFPSHRVLILSTLRQP